MQHLLSLYISICESVQCRQPFVIAYAIAAVAWDVATANATSVNMQQHPQMLGTGFSEPLQETVHRAEALKLVDSEIVQLMQLSTPFTFATTFQDTMLRYVFLRRALQGHASIDEVSISLQVLAIFNADNTSFELMIHFCLNISLMYTPHLCPSAVTSSIASSNRCLQVLSTNSLAQPVTSTITYAALDLMWLDGFDDMRAHLVVAAPTSSTLPVPRSWSCSSADDLLWFCKWKALPTSQQFDTAPTVSTPELLQTLGVPKSQLDCVIGRLRHSSLQGICQMVLPEFIDNAVALMDEQLPELELLTKHQGKLLFAG